MFTNAKEVHTAYLQRKLGVHARIQVRLPIEKQVFSEIRTEKGTKIDEVPRKPSGLVTTTVGRVLFNDILHPKMAFYDLAMTSKQLARVISDCYLQLGRRETIELLDRMKEAGFRESTRSGLSFAADDLRTPANKEGVLKKTAKEVDRFLRAVRRGQHHREGALQQGHRPVDGCPRRDHQGHDGGPQERPAREPAVPEPHLPDGLLGCPRRRRADPPAVRHARPDGEAERHHHRDADQVELPRGLDGARVLQLDARCPQGSGRHGAEDGRLAAT